MASIVVGRLLPFQRTTELTAKFVPTTCNGTGSPAGVQFGASILIVGPVAAVPMMVKLTGFEAPPGLGLVTVTADVPAEAMLKAAMTTVNCVELTNVVVGIAPPKLTIEDAVKFVPLTVSVNAAPPAVALFGEIVEIVGVAGGG